MTVILDSGWESSGAIVEKRPSKDNPEKIIMFQPIRGISDIGRGLQTIVRGPPKDYFCQVWFHFAYRGPEEEDFHMFLGGNIYLLA